MSSGGPLGGEVKTIFGDGTGVQRLPDMEPLSHIVEVLNKRFGLDLAESDRLFLDSIGQACLEDDTVTDQARNNTFENFKIAFDPNFIKIALGRLDENDALFRKLLDDAEFQEAVRDFYAKEVYRRSRRAEPNAGANDGTTTPEDPPGVESDDQ